VHQAASLRKLRYRPMPILRDGRLDALTAVPYSQEDELVMDVLRYGDQCDVVGPPALREKVVGKLKTALAVYGD
jgi:predicted DNA-binding transcriptional regulator YafY